MSVDFLLILLGEILPGSLKGVKWLREDSAANEDRLGDYTSLM